MSTQLNIDRNKKKYCYECGEPVLSTDSTCPNCGANLIEDVSSRIIDLDLKPPKPELKEGEEERPSSALQKIDKEGILRSYIDEKPGHEEGDKKQQVFIKQLDKEPHSPPEIFKDLDISESFDKERVYQISFRDLLYFPLGDGNTLLRRIGIFFLFYFAGLIPYTSIIVAIALPGYMILTMRNVLNGIYKPAEWDTWRDLSISGIFGFVSVLLYFLTPLLLGAYFTESFQGGSAMIGSVFKAIGIVGLFWAAHSQVRYAETNSWKSLFDFIPVFANIRRNYKGYLLSILYLAASFAIGFLYLFIAIFAFPFWAFKLRNIDESDKMSSVKYFTASIMKSITRIGFFSMLVSRSSAGCIFTVIIFFLVWILGIYTMIFGFMYWMSVLIAAVLVFNYKGSKISFREAI